MTEKIDKAMELAVREAHKWEIDQKDTRGLYSLIADLLRPILAERDTLRKRVEELEAQVALQV